MSQAKVNLLGLIFPPASSPSASMQRVREGKIIITALVVMNNTFFRVPHRVLIVIPSW
jgi:hypothetical protein